jgi:hypothetical protein
MRDDFSVNPAGAGLKKIVFPVSLNLFVESIFMNKAG